MIKRIFDIVISTFLLCLLTPLFIIIACLVKFKLGSPVLFCQVRPGLHGNPFKMFKFRTFLTPQTSQGDCLTDEQKITTFGRALRATSLDELPELWNVLKGEMSLVGPRPLLMDYLPLYNKAQMRRHDVKPGITGWAQVNGRNNISWEEKFKLDTWYIDHCSIMLDVKILLMTLKQVVRREGVNAAGQVSVKPFSGNLP